LIQGMKELSLVMSATMRMTRPWAVCLLGVLMSEMYFVVTCSDGDVSITPQTKEQVTEGLTGGYWGEDAKFLTAEELRKNNDPNYWGEDAILIIKGGVVIPKPKQTVTSYEV